MIMISVQTQTHDHDPDEYDQRVGVEPLCQLAIGALYKFS